MEMRGLWISAGNDRTIKVWERSSAERLYDLGRNHAYSLVDLAWDKASSRLYAINQRGDFIDTANCRRIRGPSLPTQVEKSAASHAPTRFEPDDLA